MENKRTTKLPEVLFPKGQSKLISGLLRKGLIKKIFPRIYTSNFNDDVSEIIRRNIWFIIGSLYPQAVLSHRSAIEFRPTENGNIYLTYKYTKNIKLPSITLCFIEGHERLESDNLFVEGLYVSQLGRALLENLQTSRKADVNSKTLPVHVVEEKLDDIARVRGEVALNEIRDKAKEIAGILKMESSYEKLTKLISAILSTHPSKILTSSVAKARALGLPYDAERINLFQILFSVLNNTILPDLKDKNTPKMAFKNFAFFEAYFSNFIEGTIFEIDEAKQIIETGVPIPNRSGDSHDISGTYSIVADTLEMSIIPDTPQELLDILLYRHSVIMGGRPDKMPGLLKNKNNRAGETYFVDYTLVKGTLFQAFNFYRNIDNSFAKAIFIMFVISEIHPFLDGNGRIARIMMNAELVNKGCTKLIIPTVYRDDYLGALRRLTRQKDTLAYIKMMRRVYTFSDTIYGDDINEMENKLRISNAFKESDEARLIF